MSAQKKGFTLIELLVIIAIIAILAVIGVTVFSGVQKNARDAKRKTDVESIAKAYEAKANAGKYSAILNSDFASGSKPKDPNSAKGDYFNWLDSNGVGFKVCASMDNNPNNTCNTPATNCYCQFSSQGSIPPSSIADSSSTNTSGGLGGLSPAPACDPNGILTSGLVGYWKMDEASWAGTDAVKDSSGAGNHGTAQSGAAITTSSGLPTVFGNAGDFNGLQESAINLGNPSSLYFYAAKTQTISLWFNAKVVTQDSGPVTRFRFISKENWDPAAGYIFSINSRTGKACFYNRNGWGYVCTGQSTQTGRWYHIAAVYDTQNITIYLDGAKVVGPASAGTFRDETTRSVLIGVGGNLAFNGLMDDFRIYNRVLSGSEVSALYNGGDGCIPS